MFFIAHALGEGEQDILASVVQVHGLNSTVYCLGGLIGSKHIVVSESCLPGETSAETHFRNQDISPAWVDTELSLLFADGVVALRLQNPHTLKSGRYLSVLPYTSISSGSLSGNRVYWHGYAASGSNSSDVDYDLGSSAIQVAQYASDDLSELLLKRYKDRNVIVGIRGHQGDLLKKEFTRVYKVNPVVTHVGRSLLASTNNTSSGSGDYLPDYVGGVSLGVLLVALEFTAGFKAHHCAMHGQCGFPCILSHAFTVGIFLLPCW